MAPPPKHRSRLTNGVLRSRIPVAVLLERKRAEFAKIEERIGRLMSKRADLEEVIADLQDHERATSADKEALS